MEKLVKQILSFFTGFQSLPRPRNWFLRLLSLLFAIFLWYFVAGEDKVDMNVMVDVEIVNLPPELVISNKYKDKLDVTVRGPRGLIRKLPVMHITRSINLSDAKPGTKVITNEPGSISFPRGIRTLRIQPSHMTLLLDRRIQKDFAIKPITKGTPDKGYDLGNISIDPPTISLSGPLAVLGKEVFLSTEPIDIDGLSASTEIQIPLDVDEAIANLIGEPVVTARINITEEIVRKEVKNIFVEFEHTAERTIYQLSPVYVKVLADMPYSLVQNDKELPTLFKAKIDADSLPPGTHELKVDITSPPQTKVMGITPEKISIHISKPLPPKKQKLERNN